VFIALQALDIFTTLLGLQLGAREGSMFLGHLMRAGPLAALLIAKIIAILLVAIALRFKRPRVVVFLNYWLAAVVSWNLIIILMSQVSALHRD
jgi:Na+/alanine symporter